MCAQVGVDRLTAWFKNVRLAPWIDSHSAQMSPYITVLLECITSHGNPQPLREMVSVLHAMTFKDPQWPVRVQLVNWPQTPSTMELLRDLPEWADTIDFGAYGLPAWADTLDFSEGDHYLCRGLLAADGR